MCQNNTQSKTNRSETMGDETEKFDSLGIVIMWTAQVKGIAKRSVEVGISALNHGKKVEIYLLSDGVWNSLSGSGDVYERLSDFMAKGGKVFISGEHATGSALPKDRILQGAELVEDTYGFLTDKIMESWDRVITC